MKTLKLSGILLLLFFATTACLAQDLKTEERNVKGFDGIDVGQGIKVNFTMAATEKVVVTADADLIDDVVTELDGTTLSIRIKGNNNRSGKRTIVVDVDIVKVKKLDASSGASLISTNLVETNNLEMDFSSGATGKIAFKAESASCETSSGATARLKGVAKQFEADASSGATLDAEELVVAAIDAEASSGASIVCQVESNLKAEASSGASIKYKGNPTFKDIEKNSGGSVKQY